MENMPMYYKINTTDYKSLTWDGYTLSITDILTDIN